MYFEKSDNQINVLNVYFLAKLLSKSFKNSMSTVKKVSLIMIAFLLSTHAFAHRTAIDEVDDCIIRVGFGSVHFTAYTPALSGGKEYCNNIPQLGLTNFVFDFDGKKLRHVSIEFEITKEPEGTRVFYQQPTLVKTGNFNGKVDFSKYGKGDYLAHVTIVEKNKKLDSHLPFKVGFEEKSYGRMITILLTLTILGLVLFIMVKKSKEIGT
jgi:hypothetical protein